MGLPFSKKSKNNNATLMEEARLNEKKSTISSYLNAETIEGVPIIDEQNLDYINFRNILERYFVSSFVWEGLSIEDNLKLETLLFRHGQVAAFKINSKLYFKQFTILKSNSEEVLEIRIVDEGYGFDKIKLEKDEFVIIRNNSQRAGTLQNYRQRLLQVVSSLADVDNASKLASPFLYTSTNSQDESIKDLGLKIQQARKSGGLVNIPNKLASDFELKTIDFNDVTGYKIETYNFQLNNLLKLLGLEASDIIKKHERQTETEIKQTADQFNKLIKNMIDMRKLAITQLVRINVNLVSVEYV